MKGFRIRVILNPRKAHELRLYEVRHPHHALRWPNTIVMPTQTRGKKKKTQKKKTKMNFFIADKESIYFEQQRSN